MTHHYALTLDLLLRVLQTHPHIYHIRAMVPAEILPALRSKITRGTLCQVSLVVEQGRIISCSIRDQQEQVLLEGAKAYTCIQSCEQVVWTVQAQGSAEPPSEGILLRDGIAAFATPSSQVSWLARPSPSLTCTLGTHLFSSLSRKQRQVLLLLDGKRGMADLCTMLSLPFEQIETILNELEALCLITTDLPGTTEERR